ncbi:Golgi integral membrane protein 4-like [Pristis pectinata]|uniref:Golgi integral membrane protein 4-like n=1 Tax=Pristis pectinata TaxID=685728 RepID=UPI00223E4EC2|nr:Golgi integral membrane protein 4-like [Pristis pectinata]
MWIGAESRGFRSAELSGRICLSSFGCLAAGETEGDGNGDRVPAAQPHHTNDCIVRSLGKSSTMGNGMCSRRQKGLLQTGFCVLVVLCSGFGLYTYTYLKENVRSAEMLAQKYKQQQESVSAQLQVVYEHRSRLERSLQKERGEHKKTKEDFLVYKLEAQESLNKEKQDAMNRYGALSSQHKILKNQHDEIKRQLVELQLQHNSLQLEHRKAAEAHSQQYLQLHQQKELEISNLQDNILKLRQESRQLRKAHQEMHDQLAKAQSQVEEFRQLKEALNGMPSFKNPGQKPAVPQEQNPAGHRHPWDPASSQSKVAEQKLPPVEGPVGGAERAATPRRRREQEAREAAGQFNEALQDRPALKTAPTWEMKDQLRPQEEGASHVPRITRTVNNLQPENQGAKTLANGLHRTLGGTTEQDHQLERNVAAQQHEHFLSSELQPEGRPISRQKQVKRWDEIINDVNRDADFRLDSQTEQRHSPHLENSQAPPATPAKFIRNHWAPGHGNANWSLDRVSDRREEPEEEREMMDNKLEEVGKIDAGKLFAHAMSSRRQLIPQEPLIPDIDQDPAQDPNNQGEDEFEEAELERPGFAAKEHQLLIKPGAKNVAAASKEGANVMDEYQEDQEAENEDNGGEMDDDHEDPDIAHKDNIEEEAGIPNDEANKEEEY